jgi:UDP-N-acetylglucosamine 2-epimerase (non-hydrolysing)
MGKPRILIVFGTRPECIKVWPLIEVCQSRSDFETIVCNTGQHAELVDDAMAFLAITPHHDLKLMTPNQTLAGLSSAMMTKIDAVLRDSKPDFVVVQGDTTTTLITALACFYRNIPFGHIEAGLRSYDLASPFPEEGNRMMVSQIANQHYAPTQRNVDALLKIGILPEKTFLTGNPGVDAVMRVAKKAGSLSWYACNGVNSDLAEKLMFPQIPVVLVTLHRRENHGAPLLDIFAAVKRLTVAFPNVIFVMPVHPNPAVKLPSQAYFNDCENVHILSPLSYPFFIKLINRSQFVISDSGTVQEEAPALGKFVIVTRDTTERTEALDAGMTQLVGHDFELIFQTASRMLSKKQVARPVKLFGDGQASQRILEAVADSIHLRQT